MKKTEQEYLERLFKEMRGMLTRYARQNLNGIPVVEDAVQEVFAIASLRIDALIQSENPKGWLVNTLKNVIHTTKRVVAKQNISLAEKRVIESLSEEQEYELAKTADMAWVNLFYAGLIPPHDFELIKMIDLEGYSIHETALKLSISDEACKKRIQRARAKLKSALEKEI